MPNRHHRSLVLEVTRACNHRCLHCYNQPEARLNRVEDLTTTQMLSLLERVIADTSVSLVSLSGGEPLLCPGLSGIVDFLNRRNVSVNLLTNGSLLDRAAIGALTPDRISVFEIPLLAGSAETHDLLSGRRGAFDNATLAIAHLKAARQIVVTTFVATRLNLTNLEATISLAIALDVDGIMFNRFNPGGIGFGSMGRLQASPDELAEGLAVADRMSAKHEIPISCSIPVPPCLVDTSRFSHLKFGYCALGTDDAYYTIDPAGNLRPCNHSPTILGNLREHGFWELVESEAMQRFLGDVPAGCRACRHVSECKGCCRAAAESCFGSPLKLDPFVRQYSTIDALVSALE